MRKFSLTVSLMMLLAVILPSAVRAQDETVITLAVPGVARDLFDDEFLAGFYAENPGVRVVLEDGIANPSVPSPVSEIEEHLDGVESYVSAADVLFVDGGNLTVEATRAGYYLDLSPLASVDTSLDVFDFSPEIWNAFQWDNSIWAIPVAADPIVLSYQPEAFDQAGLAYPTQNWTLADLDNAIRALSTVDENGIVTESGFASFDYAVNGMLLSLSNTRLYDDSLIPSAPILTQPNIEPLMETWRDLQEEGYLDAPTAPFNEVPLRLTGAFGLVELPTSEQRLTLAVLPPGGRSILDVQAVAVSAGTQNPEASYALAKWLSRQPEVVERVFGAVPARVSLTGVDGEGNALLNFQVSPENQAVLDSSVFGALNNSDVRFQGYLTVARNNLVGVDNTPNQTLQEAETQAIDNLNTATARADDLVIVVATPAPLVAPETGEIALRFGVGQNLSTLPNGDAWEQAIDDFVTLDPVVGQIAQKVIPVAGPDEYAANSDCFFLPQNFVPNLNLQSVISLDPFINADPAFDRNDTLTGVMTQIQRENATWAYPLYIQPQLIRYDEERFLQQGVIPPTAGWTVDGFVDALRQLRPTPDDDPPFAPQTFGSDHLLMLIAAYGGLPIDYRVVPPQINFTDPATVDAIRQVLDLAKDGYIFYNELGNPINAFLGGAELEDPIMYSEFGGPFALVLGGEADSEGYSVTTYPTGSQFTAVIFDIGTAYISADSAYPEACYRWISFMGSRPDLFNGMPARRSQINDPRTISAQGQNVVDFYNAFDLTMQQNTTVFFPSQFAASQSAEGFLLPLWLNRAFDVYVLEEGDLLAALEEAEVFATSYLGCASNIPPFDPILYEEQLDYAREFANCATLVDPTLAPLFQLILGNE